MRVVVVGAGLAGLRTVESLRDKGFDGELPCSARSSTSPTTGRRCQAGAAWRPRADAAPPAGRLRRAGRRPPARCPRTGLDVLAARSTWPTATSVRPRRARHGGRLRAGCRASRAAAAHPRRLPRAAVHAERGRALGIVGAGLIGCEVAASARSKDVEVHLVDVLPAPLVRVLGPTPSPSACGRCTSRTACAPPRHRRRRGHGHGPDARRRHRPRGRRGARGDGRQARRPMAGRQRSRRSTTAWCATRWARPRTASGRSATSRAGTGRRHEHWTSAAEQASVVAAGDPRRPHARHVAPYWWSDQYDVKLQGVGLRRRGRRRPGARGRCAAATAGRLLPGRAC